MVVVVVRGGMGASIHPVVGWTRRRRGLRVVVVVTVDPRTGDGTNTP